MNTQPPSLRNLAVLTAFALTCVGLALYLWQTFGGVVAMQPKGYRMVVPFAEAAGLTEQADVRIAGVNVGKVVDKELDPAVGHTLVTIDLDPKYGPRPADTRATLRQKTLLGETYVQLTAGTPGSRMLPDGGSLPVGQTDRIVRLADVLRTFDPATREALTTWFAGQGEAMSGGSWALNAFLAELEPFGRHGGDVLRVLRRQGRSLRSLVSDGATSLKALTARRGQLRELIVNGRRVFASIAGRDDDLAATFRSFPGFLRESRLTTRRLGTFAGEATPLVRQLQPAAVQLRPVLRDADAVAPALERLLAGLGPLADASRAGFPALERALDETEPLLDRLTPYLGSLEPIIRYLALYRGELAALFANVASASQATLPAADGGGPLHYVRGSLAINPEALTPQRERLSTNRQNAYPAPGSYLDLAAGLETFDGCTSNPLPGISHEIPADRRKDIEDYYFTSNAYKRSPPDGPPCKTQAPLGSRLTGTLGKYPHLEALP